MYTTIMFIINISKSWIIFPKQILVRPRPAENFTLKKYMIFFDSVFHFNFYFVVVHK